MLDKSNIKDREMTSRIMVNIPKLERRIWNNHFDLYGTRTEFERETGITRQTLHRILKIGKGDKIIVDIIRTYIGSQATN